MRETILKEWWVYKVLDREGTIPLYQQIKQIIAEKIANGEYKPNEKLPSERELCEQFNVSRITVRQALDEAIKEGLLYRIQGRGTFVTAAQGRFEQPLESIHRFEDLLKSKGETGRTEIVDISSVWADLQLSSILQTPIGSPLVCLKLKGYSLERPVVFYHSIFPEEIGNPLIEAAKLYVEQNRAFSSLDLYNVLENRKPGQVKQTFEAIQAGEEIGGLLEVSPQEALMKVTSIFFDQHGTPLEFREAFYLGEKYVFHLTRYLKW